MLCGLGKIWVGVLFREIERCNAVGESTHPPFSSVYS